MVTASATAAAVVAAAKPPKDGFVEQRSLISRRDTRKKKKKPKGQALKDGGEEATPAPESYLEMELEEARAALLTRDIEIADCAAAADGTQWSHTVGCVAAVGWATCGLARHATAW
jgi:hypothetical protein